MRSNKTEIPWTVPLGRRPGFGRQCAALTAALLLAACAGSGRVAGDAVPFRGGVAADEPRAVTVARDILAQGGSAADAAVALYFASTVTRPSVAGLGAGGACLSYKPREKSIRAIAFTAPPGAAESDAPPMAVRGMATLHALHGRLRWSQLVAPAEALARFGHRVSRSFAADLASHAAVLRDDPAARAAFSGPSGAIAGEGDLVKQVDLAGLLSAIRLNGAAALSEGPFAARLAQRANWTEAELTEARPQVGDAVLERVGSTRIGFLPMSGTYGPFQTRLWAVLEGGGAGTLAAVDEARAALAIEEAPDLAGTGFVVVDRWGGGVACGVSMGRPFGTGRIVPGTGMMLATRPVAGRPPPALSPVLAMNPNTDILILAAAGSGRQAPAAVASLAADLLLKDRSPERAVSALAEDARVNFVHCARGMPDRPESCVVRTDPRGYGLDAIIAE